MGPTARRAQCKSAEHSMPIILNSFDLEGAPPPLTETSFSLLSWNTHTAVTADVLGSNGTSRGNAGETWIADIPRWLQVENFAHTWTAGMSTHFLHFKLLLKLLEGPNLLFRGKDSLLRENSLMVIPHSLRFVQLLPMVKQENNIALYILQKVTCPKPAQQS